MTARVCVGALTGAMAGLVPATASAEGLYFGVIGGVTAPRDIDVVNTSTFDNGFMLGGVVGTSLTDTLRIEGELSYQRADGTEDCTGKCSLAEFDLTTLALLGNAWVDFDTGGGVRPYVGGGLGLARVTMENTFGKDDDTGLAYQIGLGARFGAEGQFDLGYRYRNVSADVDDFTGDEIDFEAHVLQFGWTTRF